MAPDGDRGGPDRSLAPALGGLPQAYASVLEGIAAGETDAELAERAGVDIAAVPAFVRVAIAKLLDRSGGRENA